MATYQELRARSQQVRDEQNIGGNTALRVGQLLMDIVKYFYDNDAAASEYLQQHFAMVNDGTHLLNWQQSPIVILHTMGETYDEGDFSSLSQGENYYRNGFIVEANGQGGGINGETPKVNVLYVNLANDTLYTWNGASFDAITSGGGGSISGDDILKNAYYLNGNLVLVFETENGDKTVSIPVNFDASNYVPTSRTVNGKALSNNITLSQSDIPGLVAALAGKISGIKTSDNTPLTPDSNGIVTLPPAGSTISPASAAPIMDGTASVGISDKYAREDHVHPHDTSKQDKLTSSTTLMTINGDDIHFGDSVTVEGEQGPQGQKGNSVVDGDSFEIVNNLTEGGDADALSADMGIVLKRNIGILNNNIQAMMTALANLAFSNARPTMAQLDWTTLTHSVTLVTTGLSHCSASADAKVAHGGNLVITLSPDNGYALDGVTPTVIASSGTVSTAVSGDNILITVANVTADVTVTISATAVPAPLSLHLSLSHCSCSSHTDGQTIAQGSTINVVLNTDTNYTLSQNDIAVTGGTAQVTISNNGATATIAIVVSGNVTVSAEAVSSLEYVNDGLVFHLDGSDTGGANDNQWVDKIGGIVFKKPTDSVITKLLNNDGQQIGWNVPSSGAGRYFAVMDGDTWNSSTDGSKVMTNLVTENGKTHFIIGTGSGSAIGTSACTIEAVFKQADASEKFFVCMFSTQASSATSANAPYMVQEKASYFLGLVSKFWTHTASTSKQTVSMSTTRAYANGSALTAGTAPSKKNSTNEGGVFIGATRGSGSANPSNQNECYLYAVRIYNRILAENEVKHNQYVDDVLYELGLNLTDVSLNNG